ncbi:MAG: periplasmic heavy metal sensor [Proteobacteria bacterium]|nr:periplasmic heavy metal sensor [Pseudomonadota bacterium]
MKKWLLGLAFVLVVLISFLATRTFYQKKTSPVIHPAETDNPPAALSLTSEQKEKVQLLEDRYNHTCEALCQEMNVRRVRLSQEIMKPEFDPHTADTLVDEISRFQGQMEKETIRHILEVKKILLPQQQKAFVSGISSELKRMCCSEGECQFKRRMGSMHGKPFRGGRPE